MQYFSADSDLEKIQTLHSKFTVKLNHGKLLTLYRVHSKFFANLNLSLHTVNSCPVGHFDFIYSHIG